MIREEMLKTIKLGNPHSTFDDVANVPKDNIRGIFEFMGNSNF